MAGGALLFNYAFVLVGASSRARCWPRTPPRFLIASQSPQRARLLSLPASCYFLAGRWLGHMQAKLRSCHSSARHDTITLSRRKSWTQRTSCWLPLNPKGPFGVSTATSSRSRRRRGKHERLAIPWNHLQSQSRSRHRGRGRDLLLRASLIFLFKEASRLAGGRKSKARTWFYANSDYLVIEAFARPGRTWLLKSGHRSDEYMADLETKVFAREWNLHHGVSEHAQGVSMRQVPFPGKDLRFEVGHVFVAAMARLQKPVAQGERMLGFFVAPVGVEPGPRFALRPPAGAPCRRNRAGKARRSKRSRPRPRWRDRDWDCSRSRDVVAQPNAACVSAVSKKSR